MSHDLPGEFFHLGQFMAQVGGLMPGRRLEACVRGDGRPFAYLDGETRGAQREPHEARSGCGKGGQEGFPDVLGVLGGRVFSRLGRRRYAGTGPFPQLGERDGLGPDFPQAESETRGGYTMSYLFSASGLVKTVDFSLWGVVFHQVENRAITAR